LRLLSERPASDDRALYDTLDETRAPEDRNRHRVLVVGGGAGGLELATRLGRRFGRRGRAAVTLLDRERTHVWKPLLHEVASGSLNNEIDAVEYMAHARRHSYRYRLGEMIGIDRARRRIHVAPNFDELGRQVIPPRVLGYDTLVLAVGSVCNDFGTPGAAQHAIALDTAAQAARFNRYLIDACLRANAQYEPLRPGQLHCAIVGAGATGVELAAELHKTMRDIASYKLDNIDFDQVIRITLIEASPRVLSALPEHMSASTAALLAKLGVDVRCNTRVVEVTSEGVRLADNSFLPAELVVWSAGIKAPDFLAGLDGLENDRLNRVLVGETLQTTRDPDIFAIGDCAGCTLPGTAKPLPPRAQTAHQQASHLIKAIGARLSGSQVPAFRYRDFGSLVSLSDYHTLGNLIGGLKIEGLVAKAMYRSLYKLHLLAIHGPVKAGLDWLAEALTRRTRARVKLH
jgi:NADH:ubiquinone reductase (H+-translocating)